MRKLGHIKLNGFRRMNRLMTSVSKPLVRSARRGATYNDESPETGLSRTEKARMPGKAKALTLAGQRVGERIKKTQGTSEASGENFNNYVADMQKKHMAAKRYGTTPKAI